MSFSRYLIYKEEKRGKAVCECTHCKKVDVVDRKDIRLRNNEKGICPFCGSRVTIKARGRMPAQILDERWFLYVDPTETGFVLRYFKANRHIRSDSYIDMLINKGRIEQSVYEYSRAIYTSGTSFGMVCRCICLSAVGRTAWLWHSWLLS